MHSETTMPMADTQNIAGLIAQEVLGQGRSPEGRCSTPCTQSRSLAEY